MSRVRKISKNPPKTLKNYFVVDACFLVEKYLPIGSAPTPVVANQLRESKHWWDEIDRQIDADRARVYVPDLCIAEAFKVLAKKNYKESAFKYAADYKKARERLSEDVTTEHRVLKSQNRQIRYHDMSATRDIIISVDRFYELFMKHSLNVGVIDLIVIASAKYLMDFHDAQRSQLHLVTMDDALWRGTKKINELPNAYNPREPSDAFARVFA
jgi:predicted nucleic acid-binding protein